MSDNLNLEIFALGGLNEVGKNCYILRKNNDIIVVDCGVKFLNKNYGLATGSIPDFSYLQENKEKIKGLFITHGHEDHIGGILYLLELIPHIPVYGSEFSIALLRQKLNNQGNHFKMNIFQDDTIISTSEFRIEFFRVNHSIPGAFGLIVEVNKERIIITGDFRFDLTTIGEKANLFKIAKCGEEGNVALLLSDSTNAEIEGNTPSERKIIMRLENLISQASGRVIITSFASNVYRLKKIIDIANKYQKKIVLLGSSLVKMMKAINKASLWKIDSSVFLKNPIPKKFLPQQLIIFCTGSQGEEKAVLSRLANQIYPDWKILPGDSIIFTSSPIQANSLNVDVNSNKLLSLGAKIYANSDQYLLHASGHACQEDLKLMLTLTNPRYFMPFHGDFRMLKVHGSLAEEIGIPKKNIFICQNGEIVVGKESNNGKLEFNLSEKKVFAEPNYVFNQKILDREWWKKTIQLRKQMEKGGVIIIIAFKFNELPHIFTYGFINMQKNKNLIQDWKMKISDFIKKYHGQQLIEGIKSFVINFLLKDWTEERPVILPVIDYQEKKYNH